MSLNKEQKTKAIGIITKSQSIMLSDKIQTDTQSDQNIYYSARPIWFGLLDSLRKEGIVDNDKNTTQVENIIVTNNAIPFELIERNELSPVSSGSLISLANEILENEANFLLYSPMSKAVTVIWRPAKQYCLDKFICKDVGEAIQDENIVNVYLTDDEVANRLLTSISWGYTKDLTRTKIINRYITDDFDSCLHLAELSNIIEGIHPEFSKTGDVKQNIERFLQRQTDTDPRRAARSAKYWVEKYTGSAPFTLSPNLAKQYGNELLTLVAQYDQEKQAETTNTQNNPNKLKRSTKWVDLATHNLYLGEQHFSDNRDRLMLVDLDNFITKNKRLEELKNIGFIPLAGTPRFEGGIYYLTSEDQRLKPSSLAAALGINRCPVIEMDIDDIPKMFKAKVFERFEINVNALSLSSELLGTNSDGHEVFNSPTGRFIRQSKFDVILEGTDAADNVGHTSFLRARSNQDLRLCAELFVKDIFNGGRKQWTDVTKFAQVIFPDGHADDRQLHQLQEAIEAASYRTFAARSVDVSDQDAFDLAKNVYYGLPVARMRTGESLSLQQYSTTLPLSVVAQRLVIGKDHTEGKSLIEPTAGNGGLLNRIGPNIKKYLMELDPNRIDALKEAFPDAIIAQGDATLIPFSQTFDLQKGVDYVITNPPFGRMDTPKSFDVLPNVRRLDHYIALQALLKLLSERFIERIEQLEQEGINPFKVDVYDWKAEVVSEQDMQTGNLSASDSSFDEPVKIVEVNYQIVVQPMRFDELIRHIKRNNNALFKDDEGRLDIAGKMTKFKDALKMYQEQFVKDHLPAKAKKIQLSLTEISKLEDALGAKSALEKSEYLIKTMDFYKAGRHVEFTDADTSDIRVGVIAEIDFPRERSQLFLLSKYRMKIAFAGDEKLTEMSLASLRARNTSLDNYARADIDPDKTLEQYYYQQRKEIEATELEFNNAPTGLLTKQKFLLEGNIYRACEIAAEQQMGYPVLYTDVDGNRKRAVLMKEHITPDHLNALPLSMNANDTFSYINEFIKEDHPDRSEHIKNNALQLFDSPSKSLEDGKGVKLIWRPSRNCFDLSICGIKSQNNNLISNSLIFDVGEKTPHDSLAIKISGNRVCMKGVVKVEDLEKLLTRLENGKHIGKFYIPSPKLEIINELKQKNKNIMESVLKKTDHYDMVM